MFGYSLKFTIGMILLLTNQFVGWGAIIFSVYLFKKTKNKIYTVLGTVVYALSWGMFGLGLVLAGPEGKRIVEQLFRTYRWQSIFLLSLAVLMTSLFVLKKKRKKAALANTAKP